MKIIYTEQNFNPIRIILTDETLDRIKEWQDHLGKIFVKENENVSCSIRYGKEGMIINNNGVHEWVNDYDPIRDADSPVVEVEQGSGSSDSLPIIKNIYVHIEINKKGSTIVVSGYEGMDHLIEYDEPLLDLPDVYFYRSFMSDCMHNPADSYYERNSALELFLENFVYPEHKELLDKEIEKVKERDKRLEEERKNRK
jgi:hypothetical protein